MFRFLFNPAIRGLSLVFFMLAASTPLRAQIEDTTQQKKLLEFLNQVELPYSKQSFNLVLLQLRESAPELFLQGVGKSEKLGSAWSAGNPYWEKSHSTIERAITEYEKQHGSIFSVSAKEVAQQFAPPWTTADLDFLLEFIKTPAGKILITLQDISITSTLHKNITTAKDMRVLSEKNLQALQNLDQQAQLTSSETMLVLTQFTTQQKENYGHAKTLIEKTSETDKVFSLGQKIMQQSLLRFFQVAYGIVPEINRSIESFRLSIANEAPAPPSTPKTP